MSLAIRGNDFNFFFSTKKAKIELLDRKWTQKSTLFGQVDIRDLAILGVEKVVFWTFSNMFWSCSGSVWALFLTLEGLLLGVFSARKVAK